MLLELLKDFEWYNEPMRITYRDDGMDICAEAQTDFWQNSHHQLRKDNGHFFFTRKDSNFILNTHWKFEEYAGFRQCGVMVRIDERNWIKLGTMSAGSEVFQLGSVVTHRGNSDWAVHNIENPQGQIWFRIKRLKGDYILLVSSNGVDFQQLRMCSFHAESPEIKVGVYACSPQNLPFVCTLSSLSLD